MTKLTKAEVEHIAKLAQLEISEEEKEIYGEQLSSILTYVEKMNEIDTSKLEPTSQVTGLIDVMRADDVAEADLADKLLAVAPAKIGRQIQAPKIIDGK